jgi:hypothetical protein
MPSLKDFMEAMQSSWPVALAITIAASALIAADSNELEYVAALPGWFLGAAFVVGVCSAAVLCVAMLRGVFRATRQVYWWIRSIGSRKRIAAQLQKLPHDEIHVLVWAKTHGKQVFTASFLEEKLVPLTKKGLVIRHGGQHSIVQWPYSIPNNVWDAIDLAFTKEDPRSVPSPFGYW